MMMPTIGVAVPSTQLSRIRVVTDRPAEPCGSCASAATVMGRSTRSVCM